MHRINIGVVFAQTSGSATFVCGCLSDGNDVYRLP